MVSKHALLTAFYRYVQLTRAPYPSNSVVTMLNDLFSRFDYLVGMYDLNKVKTIGDCYMVSSIPSSEIEHDGCARVCRFALDLMKAVQGFNDAGPQHGPITLRVGISCGSVVAGVVGTKRYLFDMWGDAVNVASRMESHGIPGQIQVTQDVVTNAGSDFSFQSRGTVRIADSVLSIVSSQYCVCARSGSIAFFPFLSHRYKSKAKVQWKDTY
jgi:adenylate cyclase